MIGTDERTLELGLGPQFRTIPDAWRYKKEPPGDSSRDLFGMVKRDPFKWLSDLQLGE